MPIRTHLPESKRHESADDQKTKSGRSVQQLREERIANIKPWRFKPGQSGNPGGKPKRDVASEIARALFENNPEAIYRAMAKRLFKGDPYAFKEYAERGFGKLKETHEHTASEDILKALDEGRKRAAQR